MNRKLMSVFLYICVELSFSSNGEGGKSFIGVDTSCKLDNNAKCDNDPFFISEGGWRSFTSCLRSIQYTGN